MVSTCSQKAVIQSRQFPFRFLAAYKVIMELQVLGEVHAQRCDHGFKIMID